MNRTALLVFLISSIVLASGFFGGSGGGSGSLGSDVDLASSEVTGVLPVANGGTNSSTSLNSNRFVVTSSGKIQEASAVTASRALVSDSNGLPTAATTTTTELNLLSGSTVTISTAINSKLAKPNRDTVIVTTPGTTTAGWGSTATKVRRYTVIQENSIGGMTYADSSTAGMTVTVNTAGLYFISISDQDTAAPIACAMGISINSNQLTTSIHAITDAHRVAMFGTGGETFEFYGATLQWLQAGDVVRAHGDGACTDTGSYSRFEMTRIL